MTTLICSGTLFSDWINPLKKHLHADSFRHPVIDEISILRQEICEKQFSGSDELDWKPFTPDNKFQNKACQLLSSVENESLFTWADHSISLFLNFWKTTNEDVKFVLFYSSPEFELSNYISTHTFEDSYVNKIIDAWTIRTRAMLSFFMNNRDRCLLISMQSLDSGDGSFIKTLNEQLNIDLESNPPVSAQSNKNSPLIEYLATTLLLKNQYVSELYDELRSAASLISVQDKSMTSIEGRNKSLISAFLSEVTVYEQLSDTQPKLEDELSLSQLQINQMAEELECYFKKNNEQQKMVNTMAEYLGGDPLLKIARQVRQLS